LSFIAIIATIFPITLSYWISKLVKGKKEWGIYLFGKIGNYIFSWVEFWILYNFNPLTNYKEIYFLLLGMSAFHNVSDLFSVQSKHAFDYRITEEHIESSYYSVIMSMTKLGETVGLWIVPFLVSQENLYLWIFYGAVYTFIFWVSNFKFLMKMQNYEHENFRISSKEHFIELSEEH
jgi:hypothetical protein